MEQLTKDKTADNKYKKNHCLYLWKRKVYILRSLYLLGKHTY